MFKTSSIHFRTCILLLVCNSANIARCEEQNPVELCLKARLNLPQVYSFKLRKEYHSLPDLRATSVTSSSITKVSLWNDSVRYRTDTTQFNIAGEPLDAGYSLVLCRNCERPEHTIMANVFPDKRQTQVKRIVSIKNVKRFIP